MLRVSVEQKSFELENSRERIRQYEILSKILEEQMAEWESRIDTLPENFDDADILRRIQRIAEPYSQGLQVSFSEPYEGVVCTTIASIHFISDYTGLMTVLNGFAQDNTVNRIVQYTLDGSSGTGIRNGLLNITLQVEYLTRSETDM